MAQAFIVILAGIALTTLFFGGDIWLRDANYDDLSKFHNRAERLLTQATTDEKKIASAIADWMTVRFDADAANLSPHRT